MFVERSARPVGSSLNKRIIPAQRGEPGCHPPLIPAPPHTAPMPGGRGSEEEAGFKAVSGLLVNLRTDWDCLSVTSPLVAADQLKPAGRGPRLPAVGSFYSLPFNTRPLPQHDQTPTPGHMTKASKNNQNCKKTCMQFMYLTTFRALIFQFPVPIS